MGGLSGLVRTHPLSGVQTALLPLLPDHETVMLSPMRKEEVTPGLSETGRYFRNRSKVREGQVVEERSPCEQSLWSAPLASSPLRGVLM